MSEDDYKNIISTYQQKSFELFNSNIVLESQVKSLNKTIDSLKIEIEKLKKTNKKLEKAEDEFS